MFHANFETTTLKRCKSAIRYTGQVRAPLRLREHPKRKYNMEPNEGYRKASRFLPVLALVIRLCSTAHAGPRADEQPGTVAALEVLPSGHIAVQAVVNGKGPFRLIVDTGSPITLLSGHAALKAGLIKAAEVKQPVLLGLRGQFTLKSLTIGGLTSKDVNVLVMDHPTVQLLSQLEGPIEGILGFTFFSHYRITIDYAGKQLSFVPVDYTPRDVMSTVMVRLMGGEDRRVIAPVGIWGIVLDKPAGATGVRIAQVYLHSAAENSGLKVGDRLLTLDGRWTDTLIDCYEAASLVHADQDIIVKVLRDDKELDIAVHPHTGL